MTPNYCSPLKHKNSISTFLQTNIQKSNVDKFFCRKDKYFVIFNKIVNKYITKNNNVSNYYYTYLECLDVGNVLVVGMSEIGKFL